MVGMEANTVILNISGREYKMTIKTFNKLPQESLETAMKYSSVGDRGEMLEFYLDRHSDSFESILWYFTNGELHMPINVCPAVFDKELTFWKVDAEKLSKCCFLRYISFFEDQHLSNSFTVGGKCRDDTILPTSDKKFSKWKLLQMKGWDILEHSTSSTAAKVYVAVSTFVILTSIFLICASTHPSFQRELILQEWEDYFEDDTEVLEQIQAAQIRVDKEHVDRGLQVVGNTIETNSTPVGTPLGQKKCATEKDTMATKIENYTKLVSQLSITYNSGANIIFRNNSGDNCTRKKEKKLKKSLRKKIDLPINAHARYRYLDYIDACTIVYFATEILLRFICCPHKSKFLFDILIVFDVVALLSELITLLLEYLFPKEKYYDFSLLGFFECIQILRVFRIFRILKNSRDFRILVFSLRESISNMAMMTFLLFIATLVFACIEFYCDRSTFRSIPDAIWWAIITMTTVGYGDKYPKSVLGKVVGSLCAVSGVFVLALLIPVLVNNFILFIGFSKIHGRKSKVVKRNDNQKIDCEVPLIHIDSEIQNINIV